MSPVLWGPVVEPDDGPTALEVIERVVGPGQTASAVLIALSDAGFTVSR